MCTVSFVANANGVIITSNRDEKKLRLPALPPREFINGDLRLMYPVDGNAGGTWFIVKNDGAVGVLLNGAIAAHAPKSNYRISRGKILPEIFLQENPLLALQNFDLTNVENCTILIYYNHQLHTCRWNGEQLFVEALSINQAYIFSSVTLYNNSMIEERENWFSNWLTDNLEPTQQDCIAFHENGGKGNKHYGLQMNRENGMLTVSVTSVQIKDNNAILFYKDCVANTATTQQMILN